MYRNKKDVDQHVESLITKLSSKEFFARGYSIGRLYYEVGDYSSCRRYVEQYLSQTNNNAAAHALLGQAFQKLGQKDKAFEEFKTSYDICPSQKSLVLNICEILADGEVDIDSGRAKYWCDKAETMFPNHPVTFQLREKLLAIANPDPQAHAKLLTEELAIRPKDVLLHIRLLNLYLKNDKIEQAFTHSCNVEFSETNFTNNFEWYKTLAKILNTNPRNTSDWNFQLLLLTVAERMCSLSITDLQSSSTINILEAIELLHVYDQALERVANCGIDAGYREFHTGLLKHHRSQFAFLAATFLLKRCQNQNWTDVNEDAESLMLIAWHSSPFDPATNWVNSAPKIQQNAARRWYCEGSYRCSQAGHYILSNFNEKSQSFLDRVSRTVTGDLWKGELYGRIFSSKYHLQKNNTSHLLSKSFSAPILRLPKMSEVQIYDEEAQRAYGNSLHHYVWILLNYKDFSLFKCTTFDGLPLSNQNNSNCGPESLCQLDVYAFLYCAALTCNQNRSSQVLSTKPKTLPANITEMLCTLAQMKWWDCAFKFSRNELGTEMTDIRATLSRGIEIVRCIDYHGLDPELLWKVGCIFIDRANNITDIEERRSWNIRAVLYFSSAIPLLEKVPSDIYKSEKHMFEYTKNSSLSNESILLEECKLSVALYQLDNSEYEKAIKLLENLNCARALYYLGVAYKKMALDEKSYQEDSANDEGNAKFITLMSKARKYGAEAIYKLRNTSCQSKNKLHIESDELLREIEAHLNQNNSILEPNDIHDKDSSDEYISLRGNEDSTPKNFSTPKRQMTLNSSNYRTATQSSGNKFSEKYSEHGKRQTSNLQQNNTTMEGVMELYRSMFEENRVLGTQIINTMRNTTDQFALLKISVDQVKNQIDECKNDSKDVSELKKQIAELKKDINRLKKASSDQAMVENELLNLREEYRPNENASPYGAQLPFTAQQVMSPFNQRFIPPFSVPPNPVQIYGQNLFNLYNQYSQFPQNPPVPGAPLFDAARSQVNYPGVFPTPDQMYLDVANLVQQAIPTAPAVPVVPTPATSIVPPSLPVVTLSHSTALTTNTSKPSNIEAKEIPKSIPSAANVVISSSDHISTTAPTAILSSTTPPKHVKGIPHNYQIQMPEMKTNKTTTSFSFPTLNKTNLGTEPSCWNQMSVFKSPNANSTTHTISFSPNLTNDAVNPGPANDSHHKTRTVSEKSNTSVDNYDPCPDFKPIIPLPAEVKVTTGEENELVIFTARAKLYRFVDNQWKERGLGEMKLLKHKDTGKVRVLMRREQIHKICANHIITPNMEIKPMKNETKAYFWVANDFADEKLVLEKFSIRFKTADIAKQFYETFNKARFEIDVLNKDTLRSTESAKASSAETFKTDVQKSSNDKAPQPAKTVIGGFTFSSTPAFKPVGDKTTLGKPIENSAPTKVNVFSGLQFKTGTSSLFSTLATANESTANSSYKDDQEKTLNKSNVSTEYVEDFEPTVEFKPVIPMLALVDTKTGEEDEEVLFENRAKLLRFNATSKEWKERGIGNIKILANKENEKRIRLLMRREQVMKVCCNHFITKEMIFQNMPNMDKAVTWCAQDFSEGELTTETFCLRFKTKQDCDAFVDAVKLAQSKLKDESKTAKEERNAAKQNSQPGIISSNPIVSHWGEKFRPKQGSWECKECLVRNEESVENCSACSARNPQVLSKPKTCNEVQFKFGVNSQLSNDNKPNESLNSNTTLSGWGDKFKPKQGSWECDACLVRNNPDVEICTACNTSRHGGAKPETKTPFNNENNKFKFGIPFQTKDEQPKVSIKPSWGDKFKASTGSWECKSCYVRNEGNVEICCSCSSSKDSGVVTKPSTFAWPAPVGSLQKNEAASIFDGTGVYKFNFGIPANAQGQSSSLFPKLDNATLSNVVQLGNEGSINNRPQKPPLLPTPQMASDTSTFDFVYKPKSHSKAPSPGKSCNTEKGEELDENEYASEDEGHHIKITPIVPLPDKVKVVTGEEDEDELFGHRAKLLIFVSGEWKERGIGVVKILRHKNTAKLRVVMRREQVFKICLNHALTPEIIYNLKDDKNWIFAANDFSEGELSLQRFCLKFKTKEIALDFKNAIDMARNSKNALTQKSERNESKDSDEVEFINETQSNTEEKKKAKDLMLPENFYLYKDKEPCPGCRGCTDEHNAVPVVSTTNEESGAVQNAPTFSLQSQLSIRAKNSIFDTSLFKSSNSQNIFKMPQSVDPNNGSNKSEQELNFSQNITKNKNGKSFIQPPKLSLDSPGTAVNKTALETTLSESKGSDPKSIFSTANAKMTNQLFNFKLNENSKVEAKSVSDNDKSLNNTITTGEKSDGKSIFGGTTAITFKNFGTESSFTKEKSLSTKEGMQSFMSIKSDEDKANSAISNQLILGSKDIEGLSFNAISNRPEINFQANPNFKWEGAGQQLFVNKQMNKNTSGNKDDTGNDVEEEYDPHYEPIIDLPDKIVVTTGEEDEKKLFGEYCKLYRFSEGSEWKERGVGELKVLYHPDKKTYRLLFRRQQVHKVVLNMLLNCDFELRPMKSDRSWMFAGRNFVDGASGDTETLAARFKDMGLANRFKDTVVDCVRKLQSAAAQAIREKQNEEKPKSMAHLRLPKHLQDSARADSELAMDPSQLEKAGASAPASSALAAAAAPAELAEPADATAEDLTTGDDDGYHYDQDDEYDAYDNEDEDRVYFSCDCEAEFQKSGAVSSCARAHVQVVDAAYAPKVLVTNAATGQLLCEMLILEDLEIELSENTCSWLGTDFLTSNDPADTFVTVHFPDTETAVQFYNSCEEIKVNSATADEES